MLNFRKLVRTILVLVLAGFIFISCGSESSSDSSKATGGKATEKKEGAAKKKKKKSMGLVGAAVRSGNMPTDTKKKSDMTPEERKAWKALGFMRGMDPSKAQKSPGNKKKKGKGNFVSAMSTGKKGKGKGKGRKSSKRNKKKNKSKKKNKKRDKKRD